MIEETYIMKGGTCPSCAFAIEHRARKIEGIEELRVLAGKNEMQVKYEKKEDIDSLIDYIRKIGYDAELKV